MADHPNIVYLHAHDAGRHLCCYGHQVPTPALTRFSEEATVYRAFHCVAPTCSPSRAALLTGETPHSCGVLGLAHLGFSLRQGEKHLSRFLASHGYHTALCGVQHEFEGHEVASIYESVISPAEIEMVPGESEKDTKIKSRDRKVARATSNFLRTYTDPRPLFLSCGFFLPHHPLPSGAEDFPPSHLQPFALMPDNPATRQDMADFASGLETMDSGVGEVLQALAASGMRGETILFFTSDHGPPFPGMKCNLTDHGTAVAFILDYPGNLLRGGAIDALVSQLDVFPTLCELAGLPTPDRLQGKSLRSLQDGSQSALHEVIFGEINFHATFEPQRSVRTVSHKLIRRYSRRLLPCLSNIDDSRSKSFLVSQTRFAEKEREGIELYDLILDPQEACNVAGDPAYAAIRQDLEQRLDRWMEETDDPLLSNSLSVPAGAKAKPLDSPSPTGDDWIPAEDVMEVLQDSGGI